MLRLRRFSPNDMDELINISNTSLGESYSPSLYISIYNYWPEGFIIAEDAGNIIGFIAGVLQEGQGSRILMIAVKEQFRCKGIGTMLFNAYVNECALIALKYISLEVRVSNSIAIRFYTRFGFMMVRELKGYYNDGEDGYQMWKTL
jgi:ribosomal-protein-alanine N-acetyltransferase